MFFLDIERAAGLDNLLIVTSILVRQPGGKEFVIVLADELLQRPSQLLAEALVTKRETAMKILAKNAKWDVLH